MKIISATISAMPKCLFDPMPVVTVTLEGGGTVRLFEYFPDEISFVPADFIGLTVEQARRLKYERDRAFLRS